MILDCEVDFEVPIILGRPFRTIGNALVNMKKEQMKFKLNNEQLTFNICQLMEHKSDLKVVSVVKLTIEEQLEVPIEEMLVLRH